VVSSPFEVTILVEDHPCEVMKVISATGLEASVEHVKLGDSVTDHVVLFKKEVKREELIKLKSTSLKALGLFLI